MSIGRVGGRHERPTVANGAGLDARLDAVGVLSQRQRRHAALRVDAAELVALVRVAATVERPAVARAHELVVDDEALGEIVVEVRARSGRAPELAAAAAPHDVLVAVDLDRDDRAACARSRGRGALGAPSRLARQHAASVQPSRDQGSERGRVGRGDVRVVAPHDDVVHDRVADREARANEMVEVEGEHVAVVRQEVELVLEAGRSGVEAKVAVGSPGREAVERIEVQRTARAAWAGGSRSCGPARCSS